MVQVKIHRADIDDRSRPDAELKGFCSLAQNPDIQSEEPLRPFIATRLGQLPPEIRMMIYQELLIIVPPQPRAKHFFNSNNDLVIVDKTTKNVPYVKFWPVVHLQASSLAILQVCSQITREAYRIFYNHKGLYFAHGKELLRYLKYSPLRRKKLEILQLGPLVSWKHERELDETKDDVEPGNVEPEPTNLPHGPAKSIPTFDPYIDRAINFLADCTNLGTIRFDMKRGDEAEYVPPLKKLGTVKNFMKVCHVDDDRWALRPPPASLTPLQEANLQLMSLAMTYKVFSRYRQQARRVARNPVCSTNRFIDVDVLGMQPRQKTENLPA